MNNKKGLSQVVTTVIFISLALIAIGIVWAVIQGLIQGGASDADINGKCLKVDMKIDSAACSNTTLTCDVIISRKSGGEAIAGVYVKSFNATGIASDAVPKAVELKELETKAVPTVTMTNMPKGKPTKVEVIPYFADSTNTPVPCSSVAEYNL